MPRSRKSKTTQQRSLVTRNDVENIVEKVVSAWAAQIQFQMQEMKTEIFHHIQETKNEIFHHMQETKNKIFHHMQETKDEIFHHFDATVEVIHADLAGANKDKISLLEDTTRNHDERITTLEERSGLR